MKKEGKIIYLVTRATYSVGHLFKMQYIAIQTSYECGTSILATSYIFDNVFTFEYMFPVSSDVNNNRFFVDRTDRKICRNDWRIIQIPKDR